MNSPTLKEMEEPHFLGVGGIRLNLGGRGTKIQGFQTVDLSEEHDVQIKSDVSNLWMFRDETVQEIYASQILEHFPHLKTESVLKEWHRVLMPGARITIGVPDFQRAVEIYLEIGLVPWVVNQLYGDQIYPLAFHYAPFTFASLSAVMHKVGFTKIRRIRDMPYGIVDCSANLFNMDGKPVSLNVEAFR